MVRLLLLFVLFCFVFDLVLHAGTSALTVNFLAALRCFRLCLVFMTCPCTLGGILALVVGCCATLGTVCVNTFGTCCITYDIDLVCRGSSLLLLVGTLGTDGVLAVAIGFDVMDRSWWIAFLVN